MTFHPMMASSVLNLRHTLPDKASVVEFGNQRNTTTPGSVRAWYEERGFSYLALDVNTERDAVICDLNKDVRPQGIAGSYDLVTNNGTSEHIFDQCAVFRNAHTLCKVGGVILHCLPFTPWINHGFFNYNPILFRDLAGANQYDLIMFRLGDRTGRYMDVMEKPWLFREKSADDLYAAITDIFKANSMSVFVVVALRKTREADFVLPIQGKYQHDVADTEMRHAYGL